MAQKPSYPEDTPVGEPEETSGKAGPADAESRDGGKRTRHIVTGAAIGIGSAALVAALMYANRSRKGDERKKEVVRRETD
jgi:hypothetical protein